MGALRDRAESWLRSDLIGVPAAVVAFLVVAVTLAAFYFAGPIAGVAIAVIGLALLALLLVRDERAALEAEPFDVAARTTAAGAGEQVLVVAGRALDATARAAVLGEGTPPARVLVVVPVTAPSRLRALADDVDEQRQDAERRLEAALSALRETGVEAAGRADDEATPDLALRDGLRELTADRVVLVPGPGEDWAAAREIADRASRASGLAVAELPPG